MTIHPFLNSGRQLHNGWWTIIFFLVLASLMFGLAFIRTKSLARPLGFHFMANMMQGGVLGFGVSGTDQTGLLKTIFSGVPEWLTGGPFGLEASVPGLIYVVVTIILLYMWKPS